MGNLAPGQPASEATVRHGTGDSLKEFGRANALTVPLDSAMIRLAMLCHDKTRFWRKVERHESDDCWPWVGARSSQGYGLFRPAEAPRQRMAHRVAWEDERGSIPPGFFVRHRCDSRRCVNPRHLFLRAPVVDSEKQDGRKHLRGPATLEIDPNRPACYFVTALCQPRFGEIILSLRRARGWGTYDAAWRATGIRPSVWCSVEAGGPLMLETATRLLSALEFVPGPAAGSP